jgi:hypothetical protein
MQRRRETRENIGSSPMKLEEAVDIRPVICYREQLFTNE